MDAILSYLSRFEVDDFSAGKWNDEPGYMPWFKYSDEVIEFQQALFDNHWVIALDWGGVAGDSRGLCAVTRDNRVG